MTITKIPSRCAIFMAPWRLPSTRTSSSKREFSFLAALQRQNSLPAAYYRGGSSRAIFFQPKDLPPERSKWDDIFLGTIGSPDANGRQLDGLGGGISSLSKVCVVGPSDRDDADVDYTFVAIGVKDTEVDYSSNCGNMTSAVGPFAIDSKIFAIPACASDSVTVKIHNTNTGKIIHSTLPLSDGEAASSGNFSIDGVAGRAARIQLDFINPSGSRTGKLIPTGNATDVYDNVRTSCIDVGNPCCFVQASELDVDGTLTPDQIQSHPSLLKRLDSIRRQAGVKMGLAKSAAEVPGSVPKICLVSMPSSASKGQQDIVVRAISVGQAHKAVPVTVALSIAAAAELPGTVVAECLTEKRVNQAGITIGHASGRLLVGAKFDRDGTLNSATVFRTARRIMEGRVFWK